MNTRRIAAAVLFTFLPATVSLPAFGQAGDDAITVQARARFKEGVDYFDKGKFEEARLAFLQAYTLKKHPAVLLNLAQSSAKSGHPAEAAKYFKQFLTEATANAQQKKDAESGLAEVRQKLGRIEVVAPAGTEISLDEQGRVGTTPLAEPIDVDPGPHTLKSPSETVKVIATVGQKVEARFGGAASASPAAVAPVTAPPASSASGSGDGTDKPPANPPPGGDTGGKKTSLLSPPETMAPVFVGLGVAAAGGISTLIFFLFKNDAQSKADEIAQDIRTAAGSPEKARGICTSTNPPDVQRFGQACKTLGENNDKVDTNATIANISIAVAGAGLLFAAGWYLFAPKSEESQPAPATGKRAPSMAKPAKPTVAPYVGWNTGGLSLSGTF